MCGMRSRDYGLNFGELLSTQHKNYKTVNKTMLRGVLKNLRFLAHQRLAFRGQGPSIDNNFTQLMRLLAFDCPEVLEWINKKTNHYMSAKIQNECLQLIFLNIFRKFAATFRRMAFTPSWLTKAQTCLI